MSDLLQKLSKIFFIAGLVCLLVALQKLSKIFFIAGLVCLLVALHWLCFCLFTGNLNVAVFKLAAFGLLLVFNAGFFFLLDDFL